MEPFQFNLEASTREPGRFNYWITRSDNPNWGERSMTSFASQDDAARAAVAQIEALKSRG